MTAGAFLGSIPGIGCRRRATDAVRSGSPDSPCRQAATQAHHSPAPRRPDPGALRAGIGPICMRAATQTNPQPSRTTTRTTRFAFDGWAFRPISDVQPGLATGKVHGQESNLRLASYQEAALSTELPLPRHRRESNPDRPLRRPSTRSATASAPLLRHTGCRHPGVHPADDTLDGPRHRQGGPRCPNPHLQATALRLAF